MGSRRSQNPQTRTPSRASRRIEGIASRGSFTWAERADQNAMLPSHVTSEMRIAHPAITQQQSTFVVVWDPVVRRTLADVSSERLQAAFEMHSVVCGRAR